MSEPDLHFTVPTPLEYFAALVADDQSLALTEAAITLAQDLEPDLDVQSVQAQLDTLVAYLRKKVPADASELHRLRMLNHYFFNELGFGGPHHETMGAEGCFIHRVLESRRGRPIALAVVYLEMAQHLGLKARGVAFPGHYLVKLRMKAGPHQGEVIMDPHSGRSLSRDDLDALLQPYKVNQGLTGDFDAPLGLFLQTATARDLLAHMLRQMRDMFRNERHFHGWVSSCERLVVLLPDHHPEWLELAWALLESGHYQRARVWATRYQKACPQATDVAELLQRLNKGGGGSDEALGSPGAYGG
jgi:regulator of sirC expression with transglutaminase-like and TPR domain